MRAMITGRPKLNAGSHVNEKLRTDSPPSPDHHPLDHRQARIGLPLARALDASCEVGQEIPAEFYGAVAKVLAFVMSLKARGAAAGFHRSPNSATAVA